MDSATGVVYREESPGLPCTLWWTTSRRRTDIHIYLYKYIYI